MRFSLAVAAVLIATPALAQTPEPPAPQPAPMAFHTHDVDMTTKIIGIDGKPFPDQAQGVQVAAEPADPKATPPRPAVAASFDCSKCGPLTLARVIQEIGCTPLKTDQPTPGMKAAQAMAMTVGFSMRCARALALTDSAFLDPVPATAHKVALTADDIEMLIGRIGEVPLPAAAYGRVVPLIVGQQAPPGVTP